MKPAWWIASLVAPALLGATACVAESLGRLFFSPAQRQIFDSGKQLPGSIPVPVGPRAAKLNGVVTRSDGETTVWVNGKVLDKKRPPIRASASPSDPAAARIELPSSNKTVRLKVGQRYLRSSGKIVESYQRAARNTDASPSGTREPTLTDRPFPGNNDDGQAAGTPEPGEAAAAH